MHRADGGFRYVYAINQRVYSGNASRFHSGDTLMARITQCLENGKIARYCTTHPLASTHGSTEFIVIRGRMHILDNIER